MSDADTTGDQVAELFSTRVQRLGAPRLGDPRASARLISFYAGYPDPSSLPKSDVIEATRVALESDGEWALQYGTSRGYPALVQELIRKLKRDQGIEASEENLLITNGASQGFDLICQAFCDPGDVVLSEEPTWAGAVHSFKGVAAEVVAIPIDDQGTDTAAMERELARLAREGRRPKLFYTIPNFQNPTGVTTTLERRERIVALAHQYGLLIVEDDAYFDLRYTGRRLPSLYSLDDRGTTIYLGTFSKIMAAGVRLGWMVAAPRIILAVAGLKAEGGTSPFAGAVAAQFCASGTLVEHIAELTGIYHGRRDAMLATLEQTMPPGVTWTRPEGGFFVWLTLPEGLDAAAMIDTAKQRGIEYLPGANCHYHGRGRNTLRLSYSFADEEHIRTGIAILADLIREEIGVVST